MAIPNIPKLKKTVNPFSVLPEEEEEEPISSFDTSRTMTTTPSVIKKSENLVKLVNEATDAGVDKKLAERLAYGNNIPKLRELIKSYKPTQKRSLESLTKVVLPGMGETAKELLQFPQRALASVALDVPAGILSQIQGRKVEPEYQPTGRWQQAVLGKEPIKGAQKRVGEAFSKSYETLTNAGLPKDVSIGASLALAPTIIGGLTGLDLTIGGGAEKNIAKQSSKIAALKDWKLIAKELEPVVKGSKESIEALAKGLVDIVNPKEVETVIRTASKGVAEVGAKIIPKIPKVPSQLLSPQEIVNSKFRMGYLTEKDNLPEMIKQYGDFPMVVKDVNGQRAKMNVSDFIKLSEHKSFRDRVRETWVGLKPTPSHLEYGTPEMTTYLESGRVVASPLKKPEFDKEFMEALQVNKLLKEPAEKALKTGKLIEVGDITLTNNSSITVQGFEKLKEMLTNNRVRQILKDNNIKEVIVEPPYKFSLSEQANVSPSKRTIRINADATNPTDSILHELGHQKFKDLPKKEQDRLIELAKQTTNPEMQGYKGLGAWEEIVADSLYKDPNFEKGISKELPQVPKVIEAIKGAVPTAEQPLGKFSNLVETVRGATKKTEEVADTSLKKVRPEINTRYYNLSSQEKKDLDKMIKVAKKEGNLPLEHDIPRSHQEVIQAAEYSDILKGTITREESLARDAAVKRTQEHAAALQQKITQAQKSGTINSEELLAIKKEMSDSLTVVADSYTHIARSLESAKIGINPELYTLETRVTNRLRKLGFDINEILKESEKVDWDNIDDISRFYSKFVKPNFLDIVDEYRYINLLSSPKTHIINALTNLLQATVVSPVTRLAYGAIDGIGSTLTGRERQAYMREVVPYARGLMNSVGDAVSSSFRVLKGAVPIKRPDLPSMKIPFDLEEGARIPSFPTLLQNIKGRTGKVVRAPIKAVQYIPRALEAGDVFFRTLIKQGEMEALAYRYQRQGIEITPEIMQKITKEAEDKAAYYIFRKEIDPKNLTGQGYALSGIDHVTNFLYSIRKNFNPRIPGTKKTITIPNPIGWFIPFVQTPMNILKQGIEYSPFGILNIPGAKNKEEQLAKLLIGSSVTAGAAWIGANGNLTWQAPKGEKEKKAFYASGRKPYSLRIGDKWISFSKLGPIAYPLALGAAINWYWTENPKASSESAGERIAQIVQGMAGFFSDQSYVQGLGNIIDVFQGDEYAAQKFITNLPTQIIPLVSLQRWVAQILDPVYRKPESGFSLQSIREDIQAGIPLWSKELPSYETIEGEPSKRIPINIVSPLDFGQVNPEAERVLQTIRQTQEMKAKSSKTKEEFDKQAKETYDKVKAGEIDFPSIIRTNPDLAKAVSDLDKEKSYESAEGETIKSLGVKNWDRAKFILRKYKEQETQEEKIALIQDYIRRKILTPQVNKQLQILLKGGVAP